MKTCNCVRCGKDIRYRFKFYRDMQPYCYDCNELEKTEIRIWKLYSEGSPVSYIAKKMGITESEVKDVLSQD